MNKSAVSYDFSNPISQFWGNMTHFWKATIVNFEGMAPKPRSYPRSLEIRQNFPRILLHLMELGSFHQNPKVFHDFGETLKKVAEFSMTLGFFPRISPNFCTLPQKFTVILLQFLQTRRALIKFVTLVWQLLAATPPPSLSLYPTPFDWEKQLAFAWSNRKKDHSLQRWQLTCITCFLKKWYGLNPFCSVTI